MNKEFKNTMALLLESNELTPNIKSKLIASQDSVSSNRFKTRPHGVIIEDTVNNALLPIPLPILDNNKNNLPLIVKQFYAKYGKQNFNGSLPWHFVLEFFDGGYKIHQTKPLDQAYPFNNKMAKKIIDLNNVRLTKETDKFLKGTLDMRECIHILIIGDSHLDVYTKDIYKKIGEFIIGPLSRLNKFSAISNIYQLNLGSKFKKDILQNYVRK